MKKVKSKIAIGILCIVMLLAIMSLSVYAAEDKKMEVVKLEGNEFVIYIEDNLTTEFEFAFSKVKDEEPTTYLKAASEGENKVAFRNETTTKLYGEDAKYLWVRTAEDNYIIKASEVKLDEVMSAKEVNTIQNLTKTIPANLTQEKIKEEVIDGKTVEVTVGTVEIQEEGNYTYQMVKIPKEGDYRDLMNLAERIAKFNDETDIYTKLSVYHAFYSIYTQLHDGLNVAEWKAVENNQIMQPEEAKNGDQYIVWIKGTNANGEVEDVQFLTSNREYLEKTEIEKIVTKLPITYDNQILFIILAVLIIAIIAVSIRIKMLEKKKNS